METSRKLTMERSDHSLFRHTHNFVPDFSGAERRTRIVIGITAVMMVIEITVGLVSHSMALLANGWHMSTHVIAFLVERDGDSLITDLHVWQVGTGKFAAI